MIKNERQYRITRAQADKFERAVAELTAGEGVDERVHPLLRRAQVDALRSQLDELHEQLAEYDALRSGQHALPDLTSFVDLPKVLIQRRIAAGLSQKELADRLGLKEQQVQHYEATDYAGASFARLKEVIRALEIASARSLPADDAVSLEGLLMRLKALGFERAFVQARLLPRDLVAQLETSGQAGAVLVLEAADRIARVLSTSVDALLGRGPLRLDDALTGAVRFKVASRVDQQKLSAYTVYAHYLALLLLDATEHIARQDIPTDPKEARQRLLASYGSIEFESVCRYVWDLGVPVLPLRDPGAFHGACWRSGGRNVIVLKQLNRSAARWAFDELHELRHAAERPEEDAFAVLDIDESLAHWRQPEEVAASQFAGDILLAGRAEELADRCAALAGKDIPRLKAVVPRVAAEAGMPVGALANYMAFRLALEGQNWWGTATVLQSDGPDPWGVARDILLERANLSRLTDTDRELLTQTLGDDEES